MNIFPIFPQIIAIDFIKNVDIKLIEKYCYDLYKTDKSSVISNRGENSYQSPSLNLKFEVNDEMIKLLKEIENKIDLLFLDEPTNHLDLQTLDWLENFLLSFQGALLVVSHDRYFLDRVCNNIVEIQDAHSKGYPGNYTSFLKQKELFLQTLEDRIVKTQKELKRLKGAMQSMKSNNN